MSTIIDLTRTLSNGMPVFPGDQSPKLEQVKNLNENGFNDFTLTMGMHTGTHIDGPMHLTASNMTIDQFPPERFCGQGCLLNAAGKTVLSLEREYEARILPRSIVLLHTGWSERFGSESYFCDFPVVEMELAEFFVKSDISMLCLDSPSPDQTPYPIHQYLLEHSIFIAENLVNLNLLAGRNDVEIFSLPLRVRADSCPARIIARVSE